MNAAAAAAKRRGRSSLYVINLLVALLIVLGVVWAKQTTLEKVTRAEAAVIPSQGVQVIQNLEGGIIADLLVREGDFVNKGDVLLRIDSTRAQADFSELRTKYLQLLAAAARMEAELDGAPDIAFPAAVLSDAADAADDQRKLFLRRRDDISAQISVLEAQMTQKRQELNELYGRVESVSNSLALAREELAFTEPLALQGIVSQTQLLSLKREVVELEGDIAAAKLAVPRVKAALGEIEARKTEIRNSYLARVSTDFEATSSQLSALADQMGAREDRLLRTDVRSPVSGVVNKIARSTIGGVIQPGEDIMEIVPADDSLLIEARVLPTDIAFIQSGQAAIVKVSAYDFARYGGLDGKVTQVAADTRQNEEGDPYYQVLVRTDMSHIAYQGENLPIIPGMTAVVEIISGKRTVLEYFIEPFTRAQRQALREP
ncbi:MAG: HlyD family type I secretion periplasmic adaptor subunit [Alphaproteobacteria bacterium]